jgi:methylenetetrahydrofolate--tRNA-(uracil-5-)-methyltransferase
MTPLRVLGGGLAGCEAAWAAAARGVAVELWEMRPLVGTGAHRTGELAELVCSNSFKALSPDKPHGLLKEEMRLLGSLTMQAAAEAAIPAGGSLAVDRSAFSRAVSARIMAHPLITVVRREATELPAGPVIVATGPLTSPAFSLTLEQMLGKGALSFYDAIAPTVEAGSIDQTRAFLQDRYGPPGEGSYINCPLSKEEYLTLVDALRHGAVVPPRAFEEERVFEACMPVETLAARGEMTLAFGPMRPVGLADPNEGGRRPYAVVQLRPENRARTLFGMVGFQTKLLQKEQARVFRLIPALAGAVFERLGSIHRNTYVDAPALLDPWQRAKEAPDLFIAGQITGVEGYAESAASGLMSGIYAATFMRGETPPLPPPETMIGALLAALSYRPPVEGGDLPAGGAPQAGPKDAPQACFSPVNAQMGLLPPLAAVPRGREERRRLLSQRALAAMRDYARQVAG